jgi:hypothetical protein
MAIVIGQRRLERASPPRHMNRVGRYVAGDPTLSIIGCDTVDSGINDRRV